MMLTWLIRLFPNVDDPLSKEVIAQNAEALGYFSVKTANLQPVLLQADRRQTT